MQAAKDAEISAKDAEIAAWKLKNDTLQWDKVERQLTAANSLIDSLGVAMKSTDFEVHEQALAQLEALGIVDLQRL